MESVIPTCQITHKKNGTPHINFLKKVLHLIIKEEMCYAMTITFSPNKRVNDGTEVLWRLSPKDQYLYTSKYIKERFHEFSFILFEEYTKKGIIHWHGIVWHPMYKLKNSMLITQLTRALIRCGRANCRDNLGPISDAEAWVNYMTKERGRFTAWKSEPYIKSDDIRIFTDKYFLKDMLYHSERTTSIYRTRNNICSFLE